MAFTITSRLGVCMACVCNMRYLCAGGNLARDLDELYTYLTMRLTLANIRNDEAMLDECQRLVQPLREAWQSIEPATRALQSTPRGR